MKSTLKIPKFIYVESSNFQKYIYENRLIEISNFLNIYVHTHFRCLYINLIGNKFYILFINIYQILCNLKKKSF